MRSTALRALWLALLLPLASASLAQGIHPGDAVRVNDNTISYQRFNGFYTEYRNSKGVAVGARGDQLGLLTQLRKEAMDLMIEQELIRQAAERAGIEVTDEEVDAEVAKLRSVFDSDLGFTTRLQDEGFTEESYREHVGRMIAATQYLENIRAGVEVTDADIEAFYAANPERLMVPEEARVRHILLTWKPMGKPDDRAALYGQMEAILEEARGGADFAQLARTRSEDSTAAAGGDTGFFRRGQMVPAFERAAFSLRQPGEISGIVETPFGLHILQLEEHRPARVLPLDEVRDFLREHLYQERSEARVNQEIAQLRSEADIEILVPVGPPQGE